MFSFDTHAHFAYEHRFEKFSPAQTFVNIFSL